VDTFLFVTPIATTTVRNAPASTGTIVADDDDTVDEPIPIFLTPRVESFGPLYKKRQGIQNHRILFVVDFSKRHTGTQEFEKIPSMLEGCPSCVVNREQERTGTKPLRGTKPAPQEKKGMNPTDCFDGEEVLSVWPSVLDVNICMCE